MSVLIRNETELPLSDIGYIIDNMPKVEEYLDEELEYESDNGVKVALIVSRIEHSTYDEWVFRKVAS